MMVSDSLLLVLRRVIQLDAISNPRPRISVFRVFLVGVCGTISARHLQVWRCVRDQTFVFRFPRICAKAIAQSRRGAKERAGVNCFSSMSGQPVHHLGTTDAR